MKVADDIVRAEIRSVLSSGDEYASASKPQTDWDDKAAQAELVDSRARDGYAALVFLDGRELDLAVQETAGLLATVLGQDLETTEDGRFSIARRVAPDRVISIVDPETRRGHETSAHAFDGFKGHAAINPDSEIITPTVVSPGNAVDASVAEELIADLLSGDDATDDESGGEPPASEEERPTVYGDAAYGTGELQSLLSETGIDSKLKTQPPVGTNDCSRRTDSRSTSTPTRSPARLRSR